MKLAASIFCLLALSTSVSGEETPAFAFRDVSYFHRWSGRDQHEFTPAKQEDLKAWSDMMTINFYPAVNEGDGLAARANAVLENYKDHKAVVLRTNSVPRAASRPAEHFIAVLFPQPEFVEAAFARFKLTNGLGCCYVYSHRIYGRKAGNEMNAWLKEKAPGIEKALMAWDSAPTSIFVSSN